jgi:hypothetical protein
MGCPQEKSTLHLFCLAMKLGFYLSGSVNPHSDRYWSVGSLVFEITFHNLILKLMFGILWVKIRLLGPFYI